VVANSSGMSLTINSTFSPYISALQSGLGPPMWSKVWPPSSPTPTCTW
jgi:hypothetical protein